MNLIVLLFLSSIYFEGNPQLIRHPRFLSKLQADISNEEPYEIQSMKKTLLDEKEIKLNPPEIINSENSEKPKISVQSNYPRHRTKYTKNKSHMLDEPMIHIDTENAIIDFEKNDSIATQRKLIEIESLIIKHLSEETNLLESTLHNEDYNDNDSGENTNNTRRQMADIGIPDAEANLLQNNQSIELKNVKADRDPLILNDNNNRDYNNELIMSSASSSLNDLNDTLNDDHCTDTDDVETSEQTGSEAFNEDLKKYVPTSGNGITDLVKSHMMLFNHPRVCYACNSLRDQSCWSPNRKTSVKYCRRNHNFCLTKVYEREGIRQVIRDCGDSCVSSSTAATGEAYAKCTVCESDLCNSASGLGIQNIVSILMVAMSIMVGVSKFS